MILIGVRGARESRDETAGRSIDVTGLAVSVAGLAAITLALNEASAYTLDGLLAGTPSATKALNAFPAGRRSGLTDAVREGFISALGTTMLLSFAIVVVGIVLCLLLIRRQEVAGDARAGPEHGRAAVGPRAPALAGARRAIS